MTTHGMRYLPEYGTWSGIIDRTENRNSPRWIDYGGRDIRMCKRWRDSFPVFYADMGARPSPRHTIERRNNNRGYSKSNCYWSTRIEQANNTRVSHFVTFQGKTLTVAQWARELGIKRELLKDRLRRGWTAKEAFTIPISPYNKLRSLRQRAPNEPPRTLVAPPLD
jgi:hypothetical protein